MSGSGAGEGGPPRSTDGPGPASDLGRPAPDEYGQYFHRYVEMVPDGDIVRTLATQLEDTLRPLEGADAERGRYRYAEGKWSLRELVGHLVDTERLFAFRALHIARADAHPLPGMDQEVWSAASNAGDRPLDDLLEEWRVCRRASVLLFGSLTPAIAMRRGVASGCEVSVRACAWLAAGHELYHRKLIRRDYLAGREA